MGKLFSRISFVQIVPILSILLVFLGPYFLFQSLSFLHQGDYPSAILALAAGWALLKAGVDTIRAHLASLQPPKEKEEEEDES